MASQQVEAKVADMLPQLTGLSKEQLETGVQFALLEHLEHTQTVSLMMNWTMPRLDLSELLSKTNDKVRSVACPVKDDFKSAIANDTVSALVAIILPAVGLSAAASPPTWVIALAVLILKIGIDEYCKGYKPAAGS